MPATPPISPLDDPIYREVELIADAGLWDVDGDDVKELRSLSIFGGSAEAPASLTTFRSAFKDFLSTNPELAGALAEMGTRLFGAEKPYRELAKKGRVEEAGKIKWRGKTNEYETARRRDGRSGLVAARTASAIVLAEAETRPADPAQTAIPSEPAPTRPVETEAQPVLGLTDTHRLAYRRRSVLGGLAAAAVAVVLLLAWAQLDREGGTAIPRRGSVVDATTGRVFPPGSASVTPQPSAGHLSENSLSVCGAPKGVCARSPSKELKLVDAPGVLQFHLGLLDDGAAPIHELKVSIRKYANIVGGHVVASMAWPTSSTIGFPQVTSVRAEVIVQFVDHDDFYLAYIPGSAYLYGAPNGKRRVIARLPEGLFSSAGITLSNLRAPPVGCFDCFPPYEREVVFSMRVE